MGKSYRGHRKIVLHLDHFQVRVLSVIAKHDRKKGIASWVMSAITNHVEGFAQIADGGPKGVDQYLSLHTDGSIVHADLAAYLRKYSPKSKGVKYLP